MKVTFKTSGSKSATIDCEPEWSISKVKEALVEPMDIPAARCKLIYKGRITKDADTLSSLNIADGHVVHVVNSGVAPTPSSTAAPATTTPATANPTVAATPSEGGNPPAAANPFGGANPFAAMGGGNPFAGLGGAGGNPFGAMGGAPGGLDPSMLGSLLQNPMMQQMLQQITSNPDMMRNLISSNPMLQQMAASNPVLGETLNNPAAMREMFNPRMIQAASQMYAQGQGGGMPDLSSLLGGAAPVPQPNAPQSGGAAGGIPDLSNFLGGAAGGNPLGNFQNMLSDPAVRQRMDEVMRNLTGGAGGMGPAGAASTETFDAQVKQLEEMGFLDKDANLDALRHTGGNLDAAISHLLEKGYGN